MPYVELQQLLDEANAWGHYTTTRAPTSPHLSDDMIDGHDRAHASQAARRCRSRSATGWTRRSADRRGRHRLRRRPRTPRYAFLVGVAPDPSRARRRPGLGPVVLGCAAPVAIGIGYYVNLMTEFDRTGPRSSTAARSTTGWPRSKRNTTRATCSTTTPTSSRRDGAPTGRGGYRAATVLLPCSAPDPPDALHRHVRRK